MHRQPKHLLLFLLSELGTSGSVDGSNSLIIKGRFQQKQIETVLRSYISKRKDYITHFYCAIFSASFYELMVFMVCVFRGVRHMPHMQVTGNNSSARHASLLLAVRDLWVALFRRKHPLRIPGCHWQACCYARQDGLNFIIVT